MRKQPDIIIENAYTLRRPFSPGNPITRRGIFVDETWPYPAGLVQTTSNGKWLNYVDRSLATPANQVDVIATSGAVRLDAAAAQNTNFLFYPVALWPQLNVNQMYRVQGNFTITDFTGIREAAICWEGGNPAGGFANNIGNMFQVFQSGGFISYQIVNQANAVGASGFVDIGFGAGLMIAGTPFTLRADILPGAPRTAACYVNDVLQATVNLSATAMLGVGVEIASTLAQFDHVFCNRISYFGSSL